MRILYLHQYFKIPEEGEAMRSYYIATAMVQAGHKVVMVTSHNKNTYTQKDIEGIEVHYLPIAYSNEYSFSKRIKAFIKFQKQSVKLSKNLGDFDLCYATSTPLTVGSAAYKLKRDCGIPYYFEVRDLWPDAPIELGSVNNRLIVKSLRRLESRIYDGADGIVALNPKVKQIIESRTTTPVTLVPNMADLEYFHPIVKHNAVPVFLYAGTISYANDVGQVLALAKSYKEAKFLIAGGGKELYDLKQKAEKEAIKNVLFLGKVSKEELKRLYGSADFALVTFLDNNILQLNSPNKFFDALANGVPPIVTVGGWLKELVENNKCGLHINPKEPTQSIERIKSLFKDTDALKAFGQRARELAENEYATKKLTQKLLDAMA